MNATASTTTPAQQALDFTTRVRAHLADLPAAELDDLLDGLHADIAERLTDGDELGDPATYADELRQAAGLPDRSTTKTRQAQLTERAMSFKTSVREWITASPARRSAWEFFVTLRPVWWVLRGAVGAIALLLVFGAPLANGLPLRFPATLAILAAIVLSVQWGRGRWLPMRWRTPVLIVTNVFALIATIPLTTISGTDPQSTPQDWYDETSGESFQVFPNPLSVSKEWNVFPLAQAPYNQTTNTPGKAQAADGAATPPESTP